MASQILTSLGIPTTLPCRCAAPHALSAPWRRRRSSFSTTCGRGSWSRTTVALTPRPRARSTHRPLEVLPWQCVCVDALVTDARVLSTKVDVPVGGRPATWSTEGRLANWAGLYQARRSARGGGSRPGRVYVSVFTHNNKPSNWATGHNVTTNLPRGGHGGKQLPKLRAAPVRRFWAFAVPPARETHHPRLRINRLVRKIDYLGCKRSHTLISPRRANRVDAAHFCAPPPPADVFTPHALATSLTTSTAVTALAASC